MSEDRMRTIIAVVEAARNHDGHDAALAAALADFDAATLGAHRTAEDRCAGGRPVSAPTTAEVRAMVGRRGGSVDDGLGHVDSFDESADDILRDVAIPLAEERDRLRDCGQVVVCATPPGCLRHWEERNRELVERLRAIEAAAYRVCAAVGYDASLAQRIDALRAALARRP